MAHKLEPDASPYEPPASPELGTGKQKADSETARFNLRLIDNLLQAACIVACSFIGGVIAGLPGLSLGLLFGLFSSGIFIMIYRSGRRSRRSPE